MPRFGDCKPWLGSAAPTPNPRVHRQTPHCEERSEKLAGYAGRAFRVHDREEIVLDEISLVPRFTCEAAEPILEGRQRAHPPSKVDGAPPEHRRYVEPRQSWVNGEGEPAKHRECTKGQVQNEDTLGRKLIEHVALPNGSAFSGVRRSAGQPREYPEGT